MCEGIMHPFWTYVCFSWLVCCCMCECLGVCWPPAVLALLPFALSVLDVSSRLISDILTPDRASAISCLARSRSCLRRSASRSCPHKIWIQKMNKSIFMTSMQVSAMRSKKDSLKKESWVLAHSLTSSARTFQVFMSSNLRTQHCMGQDTSQGYLLLIRLQSTTHL